MGLGIFILYSKLKMLKVKLKCLNRVIFDISARTVVAWDALTAIQKAFHLDPFNRDLVARESECIRDFSELRLQEESFYKHKSRIQWLNEGDLNTKFFHHSVNRRHLLNRILLVRDEAETTIHDPHLIH